MSCTFPMLSRKQTRSHKSHLLHVEVSFMPGKSGGFRYIPCSKAHDPSLTKSMIMHHRNRTSGCHGVEQNGIPLLWLGCKDMEGTEVGANLLHTHAAIRAISSDTPVYPLPSCLFKPQLIPLSGTISFVWFLHGARCQNFIAA